MPRYTVQCGSVCGFGLPLSAATAANILNEQSRRIGRLESALRVIRTWAAFDSDHAHNESTPTALDCGDVLALCDRALNQGDKEISHG